MKFYMTPGEFTILFHASFLHPEALSTKSKKPHAQAPQQASLHNYTWQSHCIGLFELPIAA
jgi:hypothetical protein